MTKAFVLGSLNIDLVLSLDHIARPSETITAEECNEFLGGKGTNQAVALALASCQSVNLIANVGMKDEEKLRKELIGFGICPIFTLDNLTGKAIIQVDKNGENAILLIPNANKTWDFDKIYQKLLAHDLQNDDFILLQNEVSLDVIERILEKLVSLKLTIVLNPAPCTPDILSDKVLKYVNLLVVNRIEAEQLVTLKGIVSIPSEMAQEIYKVLDCSMVVITLGAQGLVVAFKEDVESDTMVLEFKAMDGIRPIDSTGAGDCFIGYFVGSLVQFGVFPRYWSKETVSDILIPSIKMGIIASGLSTQKKGTISSFPDKKTVLEKIKVIEE